MTMLLQEKLSRPVDPEMTVLLKAVRKSHREGRPCALGALPGEGRWRRQAAAISLGYLAVSGDGDLVRLTGLGQAFLDCEHRSAR